MTAVREPTGATPAPSPDGDVLLRVEGLVKRFPITSGLFVQRNIGSVHAVEDVSFSIRRGKTLGLVGESGSGKSTTARLVLRLIQATAGRIEFEGRDIANARGQDLRHVRQRMQMIFQDPYASLNPRMTVREIIGEPLVIWNKWDQNGRKLVGDLLERVGLNPDHGSRYPHEFSGGQRQRIGIARALALRPKLIICDEPVSALDVSVRAQILNLLSDIQREMDLTYMFISHDLSVVRQVCDDVAVMYLGRIMETGSRDQIYERPSHPYTQALLSAVPIPDPAASERRARIVLHGDIPSPVDPPSGCVFRTRCWKAQDICAQERPALVDRGQGHPSACHFAESFDVIK